VNVARGPTSLAGLGAQRYAVIDVGTNSVKFHIAARQTDGTWQTIVDRAAVTRLGEGLEEHDRLTEQAIGRTVDAIAAMVDDARREDVIAIAAVGTAALRFGPNRAVFTDAVQARCGIMIEVISAEEEGRLAYLAATSALPIGPGPLVVFDSGGGSSQFTFGHGVHAEERFSVNVGAARFAEQYRLTGIVSKDMLATALNAIGTALNRLNGRTTPDAVIAMGGTSTNLAAVKHNLAQYDPHIVNGTVLDIAEIDRQIELYRTLDTDARRQIVGLQPKRAEVILAGACIVRTILTKLRNDFVTVSDRGLRHRLLAERFALPAQAGASRQA
jgi:exopolyphosphatase/guanosine-5'-triphosphate,3'-diphosphate pyrophosphatase